MVLFFIENHAFVITFDVSNAWSMTNHFIDN